MNLNIFCLGFRSLQKGAKTKPKKKNEKRRKIRKSVLWLQLLRVKINPPYAREKEMVFFFNFRNLNNNQIQRLSSKTFVGLSSLEKL